jgi:hypothetical protein
MTRSQLVLRTLVLLGPVVAVLASGPAGNWPSWWAVVLVLATAGAASWQPDGPFPACAGLVVLGWWAVAVGDRVPVAVLVAAAALVVGHVAALLASYGPESMPIDTATVLLWVRRGALVLLVVPVAWGLARLLRDQPEQPGVWVLGVAAAFVAMVVATVALPVRADEQEA